MFPAPPHLFSAPTLLFPVFPQKPLLQLFRPTHKQACLPLRTPSESLLRVLKDPKRAFLGLFRENPKTPQKGLKSPLFRPFLTPF